MALHKEKLLTYFLSREFIGTTKMSQFSYNILEFWNNILEFWNNTQELFSESWNSIKKLLPHGNILCSVSTVDSVVPNWGLMLTSYQDTDTHVRQTHGDPCCDTHQQQTQLFVA